MERRGWGGMGKGHADTMVTIMWRTNLVIGEGNEGHVGIVIEVLWHAVTRLLVGKTRTKGVPQTHTVVQPVREYRTLNLKNIA